MLRQPSTEDPVYKIAAKGDYKTLSDAVGAITKEQRFLVYFVLQCISKKPRKRCTAKQLMISNFFKLPPLEFTEEMRAEIQMFLP